MAITGLVFRFNGREYILDDVPSDLVAGGWHTQGSSLEYDNEARADHPGAAGDYWARLRGLRVLLRNRQDADYVRRDRRHEQVV